MHGVKREPSENVAAVLAFLCGFLLNSAVLRYRGYPDSSTVTDGDETFYNVS